MEKLYTFLNEDEKIIAQVVAENHDEAVEKASCWETKVEWGTDFYSESNE